MNIVLRDNPGFELSWYDKYIRKSVKTSLAGFSHVVKEVSIFLTDQNGPKGGIDKRCKLVISTLFRKTIVVQANGDNWGSAFNHALRRSKLSLRHCVSKLKPFNRKQRREIKLLGTSDAS